MLIKNFSYSILYKILGMMISLSLVPILINILGVEQYGIWVTFTSLLVWISLFDFGLGYALKNTVTKSLASKDMHYAQSELYQILKITIMISFLLLIVFLVFLFNIELLYSHFYLSIILFVPFIIFFPIKIGGPILQGARKIALQSGLLFINTALFFFSILVVNMLDIEMNLLYLAILFVSSYTLSMFLVWRYSIKILNVSYSNLKDIFNQSIHFARIKVGLKFFGLQVSSLVLYSLGTIIVFSYLDAIHAAHFDVLNKIFIFGLSIFNIGIAVFWPEITHHIEKKDFLKIKKLYLIMFLLTVIFSSASILFSYIAPQIIDIWTHGKIIIKDNEAIYFSFLVSAQAFAYSGAVVLNAFEKINYQLVLSLFSTLIMFPLSIYLIEKGYEISAIPLAAGMLTLITGIYCNAHAIKLIKENSINA